MPQYGTDVLVGVVLAPGPWAGVHERVDDASDSLQRCVVRRSQAQELFGFFTYPGIAVTKLANLQRSRRKKLLTCCPTWRQLQPPSSGAGQQLKLAQNTPALPDWFPPQHGERVQVTSATDMIVPNRGLLPDFRIGKFLWTNLDETNPPVRDTKMRP